MAQIVIQFKLDVYCIFYLFIFGDTLTSNNILYGGHIRVHVFKWPISDEPTIFWGIKTEHTLIGQYIWPFLNDFPWAGRWFFASTLVSATNKTVRHDTCITEILLKVALNTITP
jgi:hypothetical protein